MRFAIVIEPSQDGYGGYAPDLPGVGVVGDTQQEVKNLLREVIALHLEGLREDGQPLPTPSVQINYVETPAA